MSIKIGTLVEWTSQAGGVEKTKRGVVEAVLPKGVWPDYKQKKEADAYGAPRDHESYFVRVPAKTQRARGRLYWPKVAGLKVVA